MINETRSTNKLHITTPPLDTVHYHFPLPKSLCIQVRLRLVAVSLNLDCFPLRFCKTTLRGNLHTRTLRKKTAKIGYLTKTSFVLRDGRLSCCAIKILCIFSYPKSLASSSLHQIPFGTRHV
ncbi:uncharacterized protein LOC108028797 isoform X2 [Drosophila biarmipes]|uniref:uncharacterized protein LOC108028797 isoform X2 n=1 Tax=Drosophila biarmipes TaxID=125945 RepID=UPI001CDA72FA|nr:uncharacterized protein LOC108028797 isoform X2 [Drosophila biarmipes]